MTQWRVTMDEIEFRETFNTAADACSRIADPHIKTALALALQLIDGLNQRLIEMQSYEEEE